MAAEIGSQYSLLDDLDARQDAVLEQLDQLNGRIESLLAQFTSVAVSPVSPPVVGESPEPVCSW
jgi:hypothetical protein